MAALLALESVSKTYGEGGGMVRALDGVDLTIAQGDSLAIMGPSGSGKSTLLGLLGGLDRPTSGTLAFQGRDVAGLSDDDLLAGRQEGAAVERERPLRLAPSWAAGHVLDVDAVGSTVVLLLDRKPPLLVSHDGGQTWDERGAGLPPGRAVALRENPDQVLYGARNRLFVSGDGGRFWRALAVELPEIHDVAWG